MLPRTLEPEVMDTAEDAADYDAMDHSGVNQRFVEDWGLAGHRLGIPRPGVLRLLDVGTGTALIPIEFLRQHPELSIVAIDLAEEMLKLAQQNVTQAGYADRIELRRRDAKTSLGRDREYSSVVSNSIIHHIPEPLPCMAEMVRVLASGGLLLVRDLYRPVTDREVERLVELYSSDSSTRQQQLFRQSLYAALTIVEVEGLLVQVGIPQECVQMTSDRHWTVAWRKP